MSEARRIPSRADAVGPTQRFGELGRRRRDHRRIQDAHHALIDVEAILIAQRRRRPSGAGQPKAARGLVHDGIPALARDPVAHHTEAEAGLRRHDQAEAAEHCRHARSLPQRPSAQ